MKFKGLLAVLILFLIAGCDVLDRSASSGPLPTVVLGGAASPGTAVPGVSPAAPSGETAPTAAAAAAVGGVTASGVIVPLRQVQLASSLGGSILEVNAVEGERVQAGQVLVRLGGREKADAEIEAAAMELLSANQALQAIKDNAGKAGAAAALRLANARKALDDAQKRRTWREYRNGSQSQIDSARADVILAKDALEQAENDYSGYEDRDEEDVSRAASLNKLSAARRAYDKALANLNYLLAMPNEIEVSEADAALQSAQAEVDAAQKEVDRLKDGPDPDALALAEQHVRNAEARLKAGEAAAADLELEAPFDGTVARVVHQAGEWVTPGQPVLIVIDASELRVETSDLSERDVPAVQPGLEASVYVKALGTSLPASVISVSPLADTLGGDVVYRTTLALDEISPDLRAGMTVDVHFAALP